MKKRTFVRTTGNSIFLVVIFTFIFTTTITLATELTSAASEPADSWLSYLNYYREEVKLPRVIDNPDFLGQGCNLHARYIVKTDLYDHFEDFSNPWFTIEGNSAGQSGNIMASYNPSKSDDFAIDSWLQAPFHALPILNPYLVQVGYSSYRETDGGLQMAACLDVLRGLDFRNNPAAGTFPIKWPANGAVIPLNLHFGENPDPLTSCPGYKAPSGLPITLQLGTGNLVPQVTSHSFMQNGAPLEHCIFDETNYTNPDTTMQARARNLLDVQDAVVLMPRDPLIPGNSYSVSMTVNGQSYDWSFTVSNSVHRLID